MKNLKIFLALGVVSVAGIVAACSSSSSPAPGGGTPVVDAGGDGNEGPVTCSPYGASTGCSTGQTCCFDITMLSGTCMAPSACTAPIQVQCTGPTDPACTSGQSCCVSFGGNAVAALEDGGLGALGLDAGSLASEAEAGAAGLVMINAACQTSCNTTGANPQLKECATATDCTSVPGSSCESYAELIGDAGGDAGIPGQFALIASSLPSVCVVPPATDGGTGVVTTDAGTPSDAGTAAVDGSGSNSP